MMTTETKAKMTTRLRVLAVKAALPFTRFLPDNARRRCVGALLKWMVKDVEPSLPPFLRAVEK